MTDPAPSEVVPAPDRELRCVLASRMLSSLNLRAPPSDDKVSVHVRLALRYVDEIIRQVDGSPVQRDSAAPWESDG